MIAEVRSHALPRDAMISGLGFDTVGKSVWLGLFSDPVRALRFDVDTDTFESDDVGGLLRKYNYVHRSVVCDPDGRVPEPPWPDRPCRLWELRLD